MKTLLQEYRDLEDRLSELTDRIMQDLAQYGVMVDIDEINVYPHGSLQKCAICGVEIGTPSPRLVAGSSNPHGPIPQFVCVDRVSCGTRHAERRADEIRQRIIQRRERLEWLRAYVRLEEEKPIEEGEGPVVVEGNPPDERDRGLCPYYNSHDGSCMHRSGLDLCCSHEQGWCEKCCPAWSEGDWA